MGCSLCSFELRISIHSLRGPGNSLFNSFCFGWHFGGLKNRWWGGMENFAYCWFLRIALPHLVSGLSENPGEPGRTNIPVTEALSPGQGFTYEIIGAASCFWKPSNFILNLPKTSHPCLQRERKNIVRGVTVKLGKPMDARWMRELLHQSSRSMNHLKRLNHTFCHRQATTLIN
jgi:hypothetical protein